jgi:nucleotide sugar dehydrogenase
MIKPSKEKIAIIGHGFVGKATEVGFSLNTHISIIDPKKNTKVSDLEEFKPNFVFVCVPTPMERSGSQNFSIVLDVFGELSKLSFKPCVILKSTVTPENLNSAKKILPNYVYNPEFLREKHAEEDFINSQMILLGGKKPFQEKVKKLYQDHSLCNAANFIFTDHATASLVKYSINSFLATKVLFFNQLKDIFEGSNAGGGWESFINLIRLDQRIGISHMDVPGHDGKKGFGGACFTKDTAALVEYSNSIDKEFSLLAKVISINNEIRSQYKKLNKREIDQNVNYDFDK